MDQTQRDETKTMTQERFTVQDRPEQFRYVLLDRGEDGTQEKEIGEESYVDVAADDGAQRVLFHTLVSDEYAGQGLASMFVRTIVEGLIASGTAIVPVCPYVAAWLPKHPEYAEHVVQPQRIHLEAIRDQQR
ncbi:GNAT family N-acetyltransferase [Microbacterium capsulatum]|uniref:GNAT family N-acetyltransferase n=1 Tax=Microbacterium capsulatum TaxID=3041921 RepID=A0ABU0XCU3_9MICO|nr:GNAT family N-acetyltransferase [Microbacterium sp. ASV81]MDQ4212901.1 GNAT family N-acetyltransferase [Microbacterium sp. ASV81]